jgi:hypothetical protein
MPLLSAKFGIEIASPCLLTWPEDGAPSIGVDILGFSVTVKLHSAEGWRVKDAADINWTTGLGRLDIVVSRDESDSPPEVIQTADGKRDLTVQGEYLRSRLPDYKAAASEAANRTLQFFKFALSTPQVAQIPSWDHYLNNPVWFDAHGTELRGGTRTAIAQPVPGLWGELGAKKLTPSELGALQSFVAAPTEPNLALTLLSDAQTAWFEGSHRRSVLELAICTEILVKRRFFAQSSPAGAAFDYLEDKAKVSVRVLDLLDAIAEEAFAVSYRKQSPANFQCIDYLFRCRNKIAHRGELTFRDDTGATAAVDATRVKAWWYAVVDLKSWLEGLVPR